MATLFRQKTGVPQQYAAVAPDGALQCIDCPHPEGSNCATLDADWHQIYANPGWWTSGSTKDNYYVCPLKNSCLGGSISLNSSKGSIAIKSRCKKGYGGVVCALCTNGYHLYQGTCAECPEKGGSTFMVVLIFGSVGAIFLLMLLNVMRIKSSKDYWKEMKSGSISGKKSGVSKRKLVKNLKTMRKSAGTVLKIFIGYAQIMSVSNTAFKIPWTGGFLTFLRILSPLNLDFLSASGLGCVMKFDFFVNHMTMMVAPLIVFGFVAVAYVIGYYFHVRKFGSHFTTAMKNSYKNHVLYFVMWLAIVFYPPVSRRAVEYFSCSDDIDGRFYLRKDYRIECFKGKWANWFGFAIVSAFLYALGVPMFFAYKLWVRRKRLEHSEVFARYGFLYGMYHPHAFLWDICEMLQKLLLTGLILLIYPGTQQQAILALFLHICFLINLLLEKPHADKRVGGLAILSSIACTMTMFCGCILATVSKLRKYSIYFDVVLVSINVSVVLFAAWAIFPGAMLYATLCTNKKEKESRTSLSKRLVMAGLKSRDNMTRVMPSASGETPDTDTKIQARAE